MHSTPITTPQDRPPKRGAINPQLPRPKRGTIKPESPRSKRGTTKMEPPRRQRGTRNPQPLHAAQIAEALLTIRTVSAVTAISPATIYRKMAAHAFPSSLRLGNRCTRWRAGDVMAWLSAQTKG